MSCCGGYAVNICTWLYTKSNNVAYNDQPWNLATVVVYPVMVLCMLFLQYKLLAVGNEILIWEIVTVKYQWSIFHLKWRLHINVWLNITIHDMLRLYCTVLYIWRVITERVLKGIIICNWMFCFITVTAWRMWNALESVRLYDDMYHSSLEINQLCC